MARRPLGREGAAQAGLAAPGAVRLTPPQGRDRARTQILGPHCQQQPGGHLGEGRIADLAAFAQGSPDPALEVERGGRGQADPRVRTAPFIAHHELPPQLGRVDQGVAGFVHRLRGLEPQRGGAEEAGIVGHLGMFEEAAQADQVGRPGRQKRERGAEARMQRYIVLRAAAERHQRRPDGEGLAPGEGGHRGDEAVRVAGAGRPGDRLRQVRLIARAASLRAHQRRDQGEAGEVADHDAAGLGRHGLEDRCRLAAHGASQRPDQGVARPRRPDILHHGHEVRLRLRDAELADAPEQALAILLRPEPATAGGQPREKDAVAALGRGPGRARHG